MHNILNALYVMTPQAFAHLENATVRIDVEREKRLQVPLHHLSGLVTFGNVIVSPALMHRLADEGKSLVLLDEHGRFKARLEGPVSGNIVLRQAQHKAANDPTACDSGASPGRKAGRRLKLPKVRPGLAGCIAPPSTLIDWLDRRGIKAK